MADKKRGRRSMNTYLKGSIDENLALGTLGSKVLVGDTWDESPEEKTLISSIEVSWSLD